MPAQQPNHRSVIREISDRTGCWELGEMTSTGVRQMTVDLVEELHEVIILASIRQVVARMINRGSLLVIRVGRPDRQHARELVARK